VFIAIEGVCFTEKVPAVAILLVEIITEEFYRDILYTLYVEL
jgi:hypothetical protein